MRQWNHSSAPSKKSALATRSTPPINRPGKLFLSISKFTTIDKEGIRHLDMSVRWFMSSWENSILEEMFDVIRSTWYNDNVNVTLRKNVFHRPHLQPLETLRKRGKLNRKVCRIACLVVSKFKRRGKSTLNWLNGKVFGNKECHIKCPAGVYPRIIPQ